MILNPLKLPSSRCRTRSEKRGKRQVFNRDFQTVIKTRIHPGVHLMDIQVLMKLRMHLAMPDQTSDGFESSIAGEIMDREVNNRIIRASLYESHGFCFGLIFSFLFPFSRGGSLNDDSIDFSRIFRFWGCNME